MSQLITFWLNSEIRLSKQIDALDSDFQSGYLLGELLCKLQIIPSMAGLSNSSKCVASNFAIVANALQPMDIMGIKDLKECLDKIKAGSPGAALSLLTSIQRVRSSQSSSQNKKEKAKPMGQTLAKTMLESKLQKFKDRKEALYDQAREGKKAALEEYKAKVKSNIAKSNATMRENKEFMKAWTNEGLKKWMTNMNTKKTRIEKQQTFENNTIQAYKTKILNAQLEGQKEVKDTVETYERNLQRLGIDIQEQNLSEDPSEAESKKSKKQPFSIVSAMTKIREKKTLADFAWKEKERRRRKIQVDQAKTQNEIEEQAKQMELLARLQKSASVKDWLF